MKEKEPQYSHIHNHTRYNPKENQSTKIILAAAKPNIFPHSAAGK